MSTQPKAKNILLITSDQQHWFTLGIQNPEIKTPNLDRLAKKGILFNRAYCPNPTCTPTRASIITGMYPSQHGGWTLGTKLPESVPTIGDTLIEKGYKTSLIGKAHFQPLLSTEKYTSLEAYPILRDLNFWKSYNEKFYGFDHVELARNHTDETHVGQHYALWMEEKGLKDWESHFQNEWGNGMFQFGEKKNKPQKHSWTLPEEYHYDVWIAERTNALLEQHKKNGENFLLWASFFDPHPSYLVCEPWASMYDPEKITVPEGVLGEHKKNPPHFQKTQEVKPDFSSYQEHEGNAMHGFSSHLHDKKELAKDIAIYYGMTSMMDHYIGKILDKLEELGLEKETLVCFTTDHGHFYGHHELTAKGAFHYEDMIKIPFLVSQPGVVPEGKESAALTSLVDLAPTFLSFLGEDIPRIMTGIDQSDVWIGKKEKVRDHVIVEMHHQPTTIHLKTLVTERFKISTYMNQPYGELFDLEKDPGEFNNLWDDSASKELKAELIMKLLHAEMQKEPMWMPRIAPA